MVDLTGVMCRDGNRLSPAFSLLLGYRIGGHPILYHSDEDCFNCLRIECVSRNGFILFNISDAEARDELVVVRFDAVGFKEWCCQIVGIGFYGKIVTDLDCV